MRLISWFATKRAARKEAKRTKRAARKEAKRIWHEKYDQKDFPEGFDGGCSYGGAG